MSDAPTGARLAALFTGLQLGMLMSTLDGTIVATALPTIARDLGGRAGISWVVSAYLLGQVATMPLYGRIGDLYGRKRVVLVAVVVFAVGSLLCGVAQTLPQLLAARALQGLGGGGLGTLAMAILADAVPPRALGRWLGYQGAIFVAAGIAGPLVGGVFVDQLSWRWGFLVNLPIAAASAVVIALTLRIPYARAEHSLDLRGSALLTTSLVALVTALTMGGETVPWTSPVLLIPVTVSVGAALAFVRRERRAREPFIPLAVLRDSTVRVTGLLNLTSGLLFFCGVFFLPVFFQEVRGISATGSGLLLMPFMCATAGTTLVAGRRVGRTGRYRRWPLAGAVLMTAGMAVLAALGPASPAGLAAAAGAVLGAGIGCVMQTTLLALQNDVAQADVGIATSTVLLARILGGTVGTPVFGAILAAALVADPGPADYAHALRFVFAAAVPVGVASWFVARRLVERPLRSHTRFSGAPVVSS